MTKNNKDQNKAKTATKKKSHSKKLGEKGERAAARFLEKQGYEILEKNWICREGEADIIVRNEEALVFIEVKTRSNCEKGLPEDSITAKKRGRYENIAICFLQEYAISDVVVRFDVVSILVVSDDRAFLRHHINAFSVGE